MQVCKHKSHQQFSQRPPTRPPGDPSESSLILVGNKPGKIASFYLLSIIPSCPSGRHCLVVSIVVQFPNRSPLLALTSKEQAGCIKPPVLSSRRSQGHFRPGSDLRSHRPTTEFSCSIWRG